MVVISASICSKSGKILIARQFVAINRLKMEEYMANFPKLIESGRQCTHIETDVIRYVYVPIDKLFLVLITNKNSNIIEDLEVLRQLNQVVTHHCNQNIDDKVVLKKAFDLILSFDDVITLGYRESVQMSQLEAYLEMDSTDERIFKQQQKIREDEAREQAKRVQRELAAKRRAAPATQVNDPMQSMSSADFQPSQQQPSGGPTVMGAMQNNPTSNGQGAGGISSMTHGSASSGVNAASAAAGATQPTAQINTGGGMFGAPDNTVTETLGGRRAAGDGAAPPRKAMQLGKAKKLPNNIDLL